MTEDKPIIQKQRDRFLAFAFAGADLFIEVSHEGRIVFALGAAVGLTGIKDKDLVGKNWLDLFSPYDQATVIQTAENAKAGLRCRPQVLSLSDALNNGSSHAKAIVTAIRMPDNPNFYLTLAFSSALMENIITQEQADEKRHAEIMLRNTFIHFSQSTIRYMTENGEKPYLSMIDLSPVFGAADDIPAAEWSYLKTQIESILLQSSLNHDLCGYFAGGQYGLMHTRMLDTARLESDIQACIKDKMPALATIQPVIKTLESNLPTTEKQMVTWAVTKALNEFETNLAEFPLKDLNDALELHKKTRKYRIKELENAIKRVSFSFSFQPVIDLNTQKEDHFEMFSRFEDGGYTHEWVKLAEEEGLIADFDLAVFERVINNINFKEGGTTRRFSMNVSAFSISNKDFYEKFLERCKKEEKLAKRLVFEIRNINDAPDMTLVNQFCHALKTLGFKLSLDDVRLTDDFRNLVNTLSTTYVKISGNDIHAATRDRQKLKELTDCLAFMKSKGITVIAKHIENVAQVKVIEALGAPMAQGYYFDKPRPKPIYPYPKDTV